jgi:hypothetical protein
MVDIDYKIAYIKRLLQEMKEGHQNKVVIMSGNKEFVISGVRKGKKILVEISPLEVDNAV